jgi:hypothetical protein
MLWGVAEVNVGPLALARTFIKPSVVTKYPAASVNALREALGEFLIVNLGTPQSVSRVSGRTSASDRTLRMASVAQRRCGETRR